MSKTVLFFPGQGSQYVGMAKDLYASFPQVRSLYEFASNEMDVDIAKLSFEGPPEELKRTRFTQPAIILHSLAVLTAMHDRIPPFDYAAGHSLGEYGALAVSGALSFEHAIQAVVRRASLMEEACQKNPSTMAAILGLDTPTVERICKVAASSGVVVPANYNSTKQVVISGEPAAVEKTLSLAHEAGARRAVMLEVGGAFHSPLMGPARDKFEEYLSDIAFNTPSQPIVANVNAQPVDYPNELRRLLVRQLTAPVRWAQTMQWLAQNGVTIIIEIGPGKVLTSLAKREMRPEKLLNLETVADVEAFDIVAV